MWIDVPATIPGRLTTIDAARGAAMFFVFLSHFADIVVVSPSTRFYGEQLVHVAMIASPLFMIVSGTILGFLAVSRADEFRALSYRMIDRSLLLLTVAHVLIAVANMSPLRHPSDAWRMVFITDTIALCALMGCALIRVVPARYRIAFAAACYVMSWTIVIGWHPHDVQFRVVKDLIVGPLAQSSWAYVVPILPWFSVYFAASTIGEQLARSGRGLPMQRIAARLIHVGVAAVFFGFAIKLGYLAFANFHAMSTSTETYVLHLLTGPFAKMPPSPDYIAVYGGAGLTLLGLLIRHSARPQLTLAMNWLALVGRNSLFVFIVQYYVYFVLLHAVRNAPIATWPILFGASVVAIVAVAWWWDHRGGNRFLTLGISWLGAQRDASDPRPSLLIALQRAPKANAPATAITAAIQSEALATGKAKIIGMAASPTPLAITRTISGTARATRE
jgi:surface polysaccharide O-acyltransferase-like enzyme